MNVTIAADGAGVGDENAARSIEPPVLLPDGKEFRTWEPAEAPAFTKAYYVDGADPAASDDNAGTADRPFKTINHAAQVLGPGERVVVAAGVYRERITPARGGAGPGKMISYEAKPGAKVVVKGSRVLPADWVTKLDGYQGKYKGRVTSNSQLIWLIQLPKEFLGPDSPLDTQNITAERFEHMSWAKTLVGTLPYTLRPVLVFQNGRRMVQEDNFDGLRRHRGTFWIEDGREGPILLIHPYDDLNPNEQLMEITTQKHLLAPDIAGLGYIRVKGFVFEHCGDPMPWPPVGAVAVNAGHHWIIEDNTFSQVNGVAINTGPLVRLKGRPDGAGLIVRGNTIGDCGMGGIEGLNNCGMLIENNRIYRTGFYDVDRSFVTGAMKICRVRDSVLRGNVIDSTTGAPGIWLDYGIVNSRVTRNVISNVVSSNGAIFMEASPQPNTVDHNVVWHVVGPGIYQHDCDSLLVAHNFVGRASGCGVYMSKNPTRIVLGKPASCRDNRVLNNLFYQTGGAVKFRYPESNVEKGNATLDPGSAAFDPAALKLTISGRLTPVAYVAPFDSDFWRRPRCKAGVLPGPFAEIPKHPTELILFRQ